MTHTCSGDDSESKSCHGADQIFLAVHNTQTWTPRCDGWPISPLDGNDGAYTVRPEGPARFGCEARANVFCPRQTCNKEQQRARLAVAAAHQEHDARRQAQRFRDLLLSRLRALLVDIQPCASARSIRGCLTLRRFVQHVHLHGVTNARPLGRPLCWPYSLGFARNHVTLRVSMSRRQEVR